MDTSRGMLVPYVILVPSRPDKKLPIACIRSGPTLDKTMATVAISMMLEKNKFPRLRVQGSDITLAIPSPVAVARSPVARGGA